MKDTFETSDKYEIANYVYNKIMQESSDNVEEISGDQKVRKWTLRYMLCDEKGNKRRSVNKSFTKKLRLNDLYKILQNNINFESHWEFQCERYT